jgi:hypothetical protein
VVRDLPRLGGHIACLGLCFMHAHAS